MLFVYLRINYVILIPRNVEYQFNVTQKKNNLAVIAKII